MAVTHPRPVVNGRVASGPGGLLAFVKVASDNLLLGVSSSLLPVEQAQKVELSPETVLLMSQTRGIYHLQKKARHTGV